MAYCKNPTCTHALLRTYIVWFARGEDDLYTLLLETGVSTKVVKLMVREGKKNDISVEVIDDHRGVVAMQEFDGEWSWSVWELRLHQSFDDEEDAHTFGEASDAAYEARGEPPGVGGSLNRDPDGTTRVRRDCGRSVAAPQRARSAKSRPKPICP
jgi:hypothetical protein